MSKILSTKSIYYNDVNLIAQPSVINSRSEVPKELNRIIVSPMEAVVGKTFAQKAVDLGLTVCLHRFCSVEKQIEILESLSNIKNVFVSIGLNDLDRAKKLNEFGVKNYVIDIANGYIPNVRNSIFEISKLNNAENVMVGNVMTEKGYENLCNSYINTYVRVGIAGGSACATSDSTGYNRGNITEIMEIRSLKEKLDILDNKKVKNNYIVADGGIKNGNYACKAFGAGTDFVIMGRYFANAEEAETHIIGDGTYWGGASYKQQERYKLTNKRHSEGKVCEITNELKPLNILVDELWGGISSAISYSGYKTLTDFIGNGVFEIKCNSLPPNRS